MTKTRWPRLRWAKRNWARKQVNNSVTSSGRCTLQQVASAFWWQFSANALTHLSDPGVKAVRLEVARRADEICVSVTHVGGSVSKQIAIPAKMYPIWTNKSAASHNSRPDATFLQTSSIIFKQLQMKIGKIVELRKESTLQHRFYHCSIFLINCTQGRLFTRETISRHYAQPRHDYWPARISHDAMPSGKIAFHFYRNNFPQKYQSKLVMAGNF